MLSGTLDPRLASVPVKCRPVHDPLDVGEKLGLIMDGKA